MAASASTCSRLSSCGGRDVRPSHECRRAVGRFQQRVVRRFRLRVRPCPPMSGSAMARVSISISRSSPEEEARSIWTTVAVPEPSTSAMLGVSFLGVARSASSAEGACPCPGKRAPASLRPSGSEIGHRRTLGRSRRPTIRRIRPPEGRPIAWSRPARIFRAIRTKLRRSRRIENCTERQLLRTYVCVPGADCWPDRDGRRGSGALAGRRSQGGEPRPVRRTTSLEDTFVGYWAPSIDIDYIRRNLRWRLALSLLVATLDRHCGGGCTAIDGRDASRPQIGPCRQGSGLVPLPRTDRIIVDTTGLGRRRRSQRYRDHTRLREPSEG